jgi:DMSO reductase anchor subunit
LAVLVAMGASTLHLGRPIHAYRAIMMWRRSWLSCEVLLFSIFAIVASLCAVTIFLELHVAVLLAALTVLAGTAGIGASARIYLVPGRPAWNTPYTVLEFALTSIILGTFFAATISGGMRATRLAAIASAIAVLLAAAGKLLWLLRSQEQAPETPGRYWLLFSFPGWRNTLAGTLLLALPRYRSHAFSLLSHYSPKTARARPSPRYGATTPSYSTRRTRSSFAFSTASLSEDSLV